MKQLAIKLGLWREKTNAEIMPLATTVEPFLKEAYRHYCAPCERWFADVRGKLMHDRHGKHNA